MGAEWETRHGDTRGKARQMLSSSSKQRGLLGHGEYQRVWPIERHISVVLWRSNSVVWKLTRFNYVSSKFVIVERYQTHYREFPANADFLFVF